MSEEWSGLPWVDTVMNAGSKARTRLKNKILESLKYVGAKWSKSSPKKVLKYDSQMEDLVSLLKSGDVEFIGFNPIIPYIKEKGPKEDLLAYWNHPHGLPSLLYKHKRLPMLIIASPTIRFNDSLLNEIDANHNMRVQLKGISS